MDGVPLLELAATAKKSIVDVKGYEASLKVSATVSSIERQCIDLLKMLRSVQLKAQQSRTQYLVNQAGRSTAPTNNSLVMMNNLQGSSAAAHKDSSSHLGG